MTTFNKYSDYYDLLYKDKDYLGEVSFVDKVIRKYSKTKTKTLLSLGCGTCNHDILFAKKGYQLTSVDVSKEMLAYAKTKIQKQGVSKKIELINSDIRKLKIDKQLDAAIAMFNVIGYMVSNNDIDDCLKGVSNSLKKGGLLLFDCWYSPAVLADKPTDRVKIVKRGKRELIRITNSTLDTQKNMIKIGFEIIENMGKRILGRTKEIHNVRYWNRLELEYILKNNGFKIIRLSNFLDIKSKISENNWNIFVIAQKI